MLTTLWGTVRQGQIELLESAELPEGARILVTLLSDNDAEFWDAEFWLQASQNSLRTIWDNTEDDIYAQLLET